MTKVINILTIKVTENGIEIKPEDIGNLFIAFGILENFKKLRSQAVQEVVANEKRDLSWYWNPDRDLNNAK